MRCASLISGSKANTFYIESDKNSLLIDAGLSLPKLESTFSELQIDPNKITGILVTHEHEDHIRHLKRVSNYLKLPVYITEQSLKKSGLSLKDCHIIRANDQFELGNINIETFEVLHDAEICLGFLFTHQNKKIFFASDIGSFDDTILEKAYNSNFIGIESNYEPSMLKNCSYPQYLKDRISGGAGHLSNPEAVRFVKEAIGQNTKNIMFLHISENSNCQSYIERNIDQDLHHHFPELRYYISNRHSYSPLINI